MKMKNAKLYSLLSGVGFSGSEAEVYLALLGEPGASGYRVAQLVGKPAANTYKALDSLRVKGAVVADDSTGTKTYVALSVREYLDGMRRDLETRQEELEGELRGLTTTPLKGGIFQLVNPSQVYERARGMLAAAQTVVLVDAFPAPIERVKEDICRAAKRGVHVLVKAYAPVDLAGCDVIAPKQDSQVLKLWNGDWLNLAVDCHEFIQSFLKRDSGGVWEAVWSRNPYMAALTYNGIAHELVLTRTAQLLHRKAPEAEVMAELKRLADRYMSETPMMDVIPESWKTEWMKEQQRKSRPRTAKPAARKRG
jgi:sugar-specific transcriptional regulator TrmB